MQSAADGRKEFAALIYSSSHNTRDFRRWIRAQKGNSLHRGYDPAMKNNPP